MTVGPPAPERSRPPRRVRPVLHRDGRPAAVAVILAGAVLGWAVPTAERSLHLDGLSYDASAAQATLAAIAGAMITLAGFVVTAITLVVQTVQGMSPRLVGALRHMRRYLVLFALLVGTALYALVALSQTSTEKVPRLSVTLAVALVLLDTFAVLNTLASLRHAVTGGGLSRAVGARLRDVVDELYPSSYGSASAPALPTTDGGAPLLGPEVPGVIQSIDEVRLLKLAAAHRVRVELSSEVGEFTGSRAAVGRVVPLDGAEPAPALLRRMERCVRYGPARTIDQDAAYGLRLLADISIRALSPAVNDPTTAVQALDLIEDALTRLAGRALGPVALLDPTGFPWVVQPGPNWADLVGLALDETLLYGAESPQVLRRARALLTRVRAVAPTHRHPALDARAEALERAAARLPDPLLQAAALDPDPMGLGGPLL